ncbi:RluA family pseudouridine synthase [Paraglaciecola sp. L3A3]|uniref:RluA family pseudouridine synthase n=1 Tax=Paraglaciecola sp. L3A3 TaxID=2686358 RepID=UPI0018EED3BE|nr:RluA family pseudouridine synthase [Paraglaciecola sp. L3A3]
MELIDDKCFTQFVESTDKFSLPERFTFPFYYQPHPLCIMAAEQLKQHIAMQNRWQHNFGLTDDANKIIGKMFGVLLVKNKQGKLGFLSAFSGKLAEQNHISGFVPPVFDLLAEDSFFLSEQAEINRVNQQLESLENSIELLQLLEQLQGVKQQSSKEISELRNELSDNRQQRKLTRQTIAEELAKQNKETILQTLAQQSVNDKWRLKELTNKWQLKSEVIQTQIDTFEHQISSLKLKRKRYSSQLQNKIFSQYRFLNKNLEKKNLLDIFAGTSLGTPPAGAGECAAPKLLQYAFSHQYTPLALAEFWWGASPKSEVKKHQQFYPACTGKCQPILKHMLTGMEVDDNPLLKNYGEGKQLEIVYQDNDLLVVNKPAEFLSVPGKDVSDSVYQRIKQLFPTAAGPLIVHRLDMSTSGLMVLALNSQTNKGLQKQFIRRQVEKEYVALVEGLIENEQGEINLPLRGDLFDRPKQLVCFEHGKPAKTVWQVLQRFPQNGRTKVLLKPHTGRTHQLRVHCAHVEGLNMPIVGDDLYGTLDERLYLHAQRLAFVHPVTNKPLVFECKACY